MSGGLRSARATGSARVLTPRVGTSDLPPFDPGPAPRGGWTLDAAVRTFLAYGAAHADESAAAWAAFLALGETAPGLRRAEHVARLRGEPDPFADRPSALDARPDLAPPF